MENLNVTRSKRVVNNVEIETFITEIESANSIQVEVGTTGYCGGDTGHGGRTYLSIGDLASTDMNANVYGCRDCAEKFELEFGGDTELSTFIQALEFALHELKKKAKETKR